MTQKTESRSERARRLGPATFDHLRSKKKPLTKKLPIHLDGEAVVELDEARQERARQKLGQGPADPDLDQRIADLRDRVEESTVEMVFRSIGRKNYEELVREHPPTDEQTKEYQEETGDDGPAPYNTETFPIALIAATSVQPKMTEAEVDILWNGEYDEDGEEISPAWNTPELMAMFQAALEVCTQRKVTHLGE